MKRSIELKIKIKSLAAEAAIIRHEERNLRAERKWNLQHHRKTVVRDAARRTLIAYAHIRGRDVTPHLSQNAYWRIVDHDHVVKMVHKYGDPESIARIPKRFGTTEIKAAA